MGYKQSLAIAVLVLKLLQPSPSAWAQASDPFIGQLMMGAWNFCPTGWLKADGQILPIAQNTALFSLLGTMYGGDRRTTFALPDLRGRVPVQWGNGPGGLVTQRGSTPLQGNIPATSERRVTQRVAPNPCDPGRLFR